MNDLTHLRARNLERQVVSAAARSSQVPVAMAAIGSVSARGPAHFNMMVRYLDALMARRKFPEASLNECAAHLGLTKHQYSARLRRAFEYAEKLRGAA